MTTLQFNIFSATDSQHPTSNPIQGATITFSQNNNVVATASTNDAGRAIISVPAGDYNVRITATGFNTLSFAYGADTDKSETFYTGYAFVPPSMLGYMLILAVVGSGIAVYYMWKGGH